MIIAGIAAALVLSLVIVSGRWGVAGAVVGGGGLALAGIRLIVGPKLGGELVMWCSLLAAIAGVVVAIAANSH